MAVKQETHGTLPTQLPTQQLVAQYHRYHITNSPFCSHNTIPSQSLIILDLVSYQLVARELTPMELGELGR